MPLVSLGLVTGGADAIPRHLANCGSDRHHKLVYIITWIWILELLYSNCMQRTRAMTRFATHALKMFGYLGRRPKNEPRRLAEGRRVAFEA
jgi:hypothetical protein